MSILIKPVITEKATKMSEVSNCFTFLVKKNANKVEVKKAVESAYGVSVEKVRTINVRVERSNRHTKTGMVTAHKGAIKKAYVQLAEGDVIDFYTNM
jgi:large subunit ribosomal protein L23